VAFEIERQRVKELFDHTSDGVMVIDRTLRIVALNPAAEGLTRCSAVDAVGVRVCNEVAICQSADGLELCEAACPGLAALERGKRSLELDVNIPGRSGWVAPAVCIPMKAEDGSPLAMILIRDVSGHAELQEQLLTGERFDRVTGLYTKTHFEELYRREIKLAERQRRSLAAVFLTVAGDVLDSRDGDRILRAFAEAIQASGRKVDIVGRYDYQTYAVVLLDTVETGAASFIGRLKTRVQQKIRTIEGLGDALTVKHGIGTSVQDGYEGLLKAAKQRVAGGEAW